MSKLDLKRLPMGEDILPYLREDDWFKEAQLRRVTVELTQFGEQMDLFDGKRTQLIQEAISLIAELPQILGGSTSQKSANRVKDLRRKALRLKETLDSSFNTFVRGPYRSFSNEELQLDDLHLLAFRSALIHRFRSVIEYDTKACLRTIDKLIDRCESI